MASRVLLKSAYKQSAQAMSTRRCLVSAGRSLPIHRHVRGRFVRIAALMGQVCPETDRWAASSSRISTGSDRNKLMDTFITIFQSDTCLISVCFGPILLAAVLIGLHYVGLWRLNRQPGVDNRQIGRYRTASGLVILGILLSPVPLWTAHYIVNETIVFPMQLSQTRSDADELVGHLSRA